MARSITSANSTLTLNVPDVFPGPVNISGYGVDEAFSTEIVEIVQARIGVDGKKSSGFVPFLTPCTITLAANSPSVDFFEAWIAAIIAQQQDFEVQGALALPSLGKSVNLVNGSLTRGKQLPDLKKLLESQTFQITWESVQPSLAS